VEGWKNSPGHYKNIIIPELNLTGVTVSCNPLSQIVFGVQKFGMTQTTLNGNKIIDLFPEFDTRLDFENEFMYEQPKTHRRHAWKIRSGKDIKITDMRRSERLKSISFKDLSIHRNSDSMVIRFAPLRSISHIFRNKKDGLALEFITFEDYFSDSVYFTKPALRNNTCIFNGYVTKPRYKKEITLIAKSQLAGRQGDFFVYSETIPEKIKNFPFQVNLLVLNNNRIIDRIHFRTRIGGFIDFPVHTDTIPYDYAIKDVNLAFHPQRYTLFKTPE